MTQLLSRLREPSTYAGLAAVLAAAGVNLDPSLFQALTLTATGIAGLVAVLLPEKARP